MCSVKRARTLVIKVPVASNTGVMLQWVLIYTDLFYAMCTPVRASQCRVHE